MAIETMTEAERITANSASSKRSPSSNLDKDDFLKLLCTQLQNQDPTSPMEDMEFISEMASFSSLEQMLNINTSVEGIAKQMGASQTKEAMMYLGTNVVSNVTDNNGNPVTGTVDMVGFSDGEAYLKVGDTALTLDQIKLCSI